jgi:hypothetical protein
MGRSPRETWSWAAAAKQVHFPALIRAAKRLAFGRMTALTAHFDGKVLALLSAAATCVALASQILFQNLSRSAHPPAVQLHQS